jgi:general bacterial porin, GBP family
MKRSLIALAALAAAGAASAQSSVTLYGRVEANVTLQSPGNNASVNTGGERGGDVWKLNDGGVNGIGGSRWGLRGNEDLGGGLKAYFVLESGFSSDSGNAGSSSQIFNRQSYVALGSSSLGDLRLGRIDTLARQINTGFGDVTAEGEITVSESVVGTGRPLFQNLGTRVSNAVTYISPNWGGFQVTGLVGLGEGATARHDGIAGTFRSGPIAVGVSYEQYDGSDTYNEVITLGGNYNFGFATFYAGYQNTSDFGTSTSFTPGTDHEAWNLGVMVPWGNWQFRGQYISSIVETPSVDLDQEKWGLSARYSLSKRTTLYGVFTQRTGDNNDRFPRRQETAVGVAHTF